MSRTVQIPSSLVFSTDVASGLIEHQHLPPQLDADTHASLMLVLTELDLQFQQKLQFALKGKYVVKSCTLSAALAKAQ